MPSAYGVLGLLNVLLESFGIMILNKIHALSIHPLDRLPNLPMLLIVLCVIEPLAPMTKIRGYHKNSIWVIKVRGKQLSILLLHRIVSSSNHDRDQFQVLPHALANEGQMHLQTVLFVLIIRLDILKLSLLFELFRCYIGANLLFLSTATRPRGVSQ